MCWWRGEVKWKIAEFACSLGWFYVASIALHEMWHSAVTQILGGKGTVEYFYFFGGLLRFQEVPPHVWVVYLSGGLLTALTMAVFLWFWARRSPTKWDLDDEAALAIIMGTHFCYAWTELFIWAGNMQAFWIAAPIAAFVGTVVPGIYYMPKLVDWWLGPNKDGGVKRIW